MNLYRISQNQNNDYDTYDSAVVAAPDEETAKNMNPSGAGMMTEEKWKYPYSSWCTSAEYVNVEFIGTATDGIEQSVICASFNAG